MDIENLSKAQLLLLTLLVNFIVSIATGIVTVSLLEKAPPVLTQTINRIVERTVETVVPGSLPSIVTREKTVIVNEEDLVIAAVAAAQARTVTLTFGSEDASPMFGTFLPKARSVVTLGKDTGEKEATILFPDGTIATSSLSRTLDGVQLFAFPDSTKLPEAPAFAFMQAKNVRAGQSVFAIADDGSVVTGIISLSTAEKIKTTLPAVPVGSEIVNASGDLIGLANLSAGSLVSSDAIEALFAATSTSSGTQ
jgi:hypothetical protein